MTEPLVEQARRLADRVRGLSVAVDELDKRTDRAGRVQVFVIFGLLLDVLLSIAVTLVVVNQFTAAEKLRHAVERESTTRSQGLCPLYGLIVGSYNPASRKEGPDRDAYIKSFQTLRDAHESLECNQAPVPPRSDQTPVPVPTR